MTTAGREGHAHRDAEPDESQEIPAGRVHRFHGSPPRRRPRPPRLVSVRLVAPSAGDHSARAAGRKKFRSGQGRVAREARPAQGGCQGSHANVFILRSERGFPRAASVPNASKGRYCACASPPSTRDQTEICFDPADAARLSGGPVTQQPTPSPSGRGRTRPALARAGRAAPRGDDAGGEGRPAGQPLGGQQPGGRAWRRGQRPAGGADAGRVRRVGHGAAGRGEPARARAPHPGLRERAGHGDRGGRRAGPPATHRHGVLPVRHPRPRARGVPDRLHGVRRHGLSRPPSPGARPGTPSWFAGWPRRSAATWPRWACTRASPPCSTSCATTGGAGRGDPRRGPLPRRLAGHRLRAGPPVGRRDRDPEALRRLLRLACRHATTARCRWAPASCATSSSPRSRRPSRSVEPAR